MGFNLVFKGLRDVIEQILTLFFQNLSDEVREYRFILIDILQDATLHSSLISGNCSTCFGWYLHPSSGAHTTVSTASGICHTVTATCR